MNNKHLTCDIFSLYTDPDADKDGQTDEQSNNEEGQGNKTIVKFMVQNSKHIVMGIESSYKCEVQVV